MEDLSHFYWHDIEQEIYHLLKGYGFSNFELVCVPDTTLLTLKQVSMTNFQKLRSVSNVPVSFYKDYYRHIKPVYKEFVKSLAPDAFFIPGESGYHRKKEELMLSYGFRSDLIVALPNRICKGWFPCFSLFSNMSVSELQESLFEIEQSLVPKLSRIVTEFLAESYLDFNPYFYNGLFPERVLTVLHYLAEGCSSKDIAQKVRISPSTVEYHTYNMTNKLKASNRVNLIYKAMEIGLI